MCSAAILCTFTSWVTGKHIIGYDRESRQTYTANVAAEEYARHSIVHSKAQLLATT